MATILTEGVSHVYSSLETTLSVFDDFQNFKEPEEFVVELLTNAGLQVLQQFGQSNMVAQTVAQVLAAAVWAIGVATQARATELAKDLPLPPLQSEDPATDVWQVNRVFEVFRKRGSGGIVYPDGGVESASNADYTSLYLPAYKHNGDWKIQHRTGGVAAQQGRPQRSRSPTGETQYLFDPGDASTFGFMPGTSTSLRVLQSSYRFYKTPRGTDVDRYALRCRGINKPCYQTPKGFNGSRDCRQCVKAESVWPTQGLGWAYGGAPLNATTPGENVGIFYPSTNKILGNILDTISGPGPLLYTLNLYEIERQWRSVFERFWTFADEEWNRHRGAGWRGLISRLATLMTAFEKDGGYRPGGRDPDMPLARIASPRNPRFSIPFSESIFARLIQPFCTDLVRIQLHYLHTVEVAYIPPGAGALYYPSGEIRRHSLGEKFRNARADLLGSSKRMMVDLRQVSDPVYRADLERSGVKLSLVSLRLRGSPGLGHELLKPDLKPARAISPPKVSRASPFAGTNKLEILRPERLRHKPARAQSTGSEKHRGRQAAALGVTAGSLIAVATGLFALEKQRKDESG